MQFSSLTLSTRAHAVIGAVLALLALVALSPIVDIVVQALPLATGEVQWRFRVFGAIVTSLPQLALLLAAITGVAVLTGQRLAVRGAAVAALLLAVVAAALLPFFALDFLEMRRLVPLERKRGFDAGIMKTGLFGGLFVLMLGYLGWRGMAASTKEKTTERKEGQGLIVGQD